VNALAIQMRKASSMSILQSTIDISNEGNDRLDEFQNYATAQLDDPDALVTLALIADFKKEARDNGEELTRLKRLARSSDESRAALKEMHFVGWFGRLRQFQNWLSTKCDQQDAVRVLRWIAEFEHKLVEEWLKQNVEGFLGDPPDNDFLHGFLSALLLVNEEALGLPLYLHPFAEAEGLSSRYVHKKRSARSAA
jgi:hypothetical protein